MKTNNKEVREGSLACTRPHFQCCQPQFPGKLKTAYTFWFSLCTYVGGV